MSGPVMQRCQCPDCGREVFRIDCFGVLSPGQYERVEGGSLRLGVGEMVLAVNGGYDTHKCPRWSRDWLQAQTDRGDDHVTQHEWTGERG